MNEDAVGQREAVEVLQRSRAGHGDATEALMRLAYDELYRIAARYMARERSSHTLQPTALLNEAYIRIFAQQQVDWVDRNHFIAVAAEMMRRVLVDHARARNREKRGGGKSSESIDVFTIPVDDSGRRVDLVDLSEALDRLAERDDRLRRVVELKFLAGLGNEEVANVLSVSRATVASDWTVAKAWLRAELTLPPEPPDASA